MSDPYDYPKVCECCGNKQFNHFSDFGWDYDYCTECNAAYDEEGNLIPEGPEPDVNDLIDVEQPDVNDGQQIMHNLLTRR